MTKEYKFKVGDKVRLIRGWSDGSTTGFNTGRLQLYSVYEITDVIVDNYDAGIEYPYYIEEAGYNVEECMIELDEEDVDEHGLPTPKETPPMPTSVQTTSEVDCKEYTGGSVSYYSVVVDQPTSGGSPYTAECNDIIEALHMNYAEGNAFKAIWRSCAARNGNSKKGYTDGLYDAEKVVFFGNRMVKQAERNRE